MRNTVAVISRWRADTSPRLRINSGFTSSTRYAVGITAITVKAGNPVGLNLSATPTLMSHRSKGVAVQPIRLRFSRQLEKGQTWRYKEIEPGMVIGGFYVSKLAIHYAFDGNPPKALKVTIEPADDES